MITWWAEREFAVFLGRLNISESVQGSRVSTAPVVSVFKLLVFHRLPDESIDIVAETEGRCQVWNRWRREQQLVTAKN